MHVKRYTIKVDGLALTGLEYMTRREAEGAMAFARCIYWKKLVEMMDNETGEIIDRIPGLDNL